ncbi:MAG: response regulator [Planctomycetota bacterium]
MAEAATIWVVDDEAAALRSTELVLLSEGYDAVRCFVSPLDALDALATHQPELIIADLCMPGMTGFDIAKAVRQIDEKVPFLICSGFLVDEDYQTIDRYENMEALLKPLEIQNLAVKIRDMLEAAKVE